jgi:hypothetical protein
MMFHIFDGLRPMIYLDNRLEIQILITSASFSLDNRGACAIIRAITSS